MLPAHNQVQLPFRWICNMRDSRSCDRARREMNVDVWSCMQVVQAANQLDVCTFLRIISICVCVSSQSRHVNIYSLHNGTEWSSFLRGDSPSIVGRLRYHNTSTLVFRIAQCSGVLSVTLRLATARRRLCNIYAIHAPARRAIVNASSSTCLWAFWSMAHIKYVAYWHFIILALLIISLPVTAGASGHSWWCSGCLSCDTDYSSSKIRHLYLIACGHYRQYIHACQPFHAPLQNDETTMTLSDRNCAAMA